MLHIVIPLILFSSARVSAFYSFKSWTSFTLYRNAIVYSKTCGAVSCKFRVHLKPEIFEMMVISRDLRNYA